MLAVVVSDVEVEDEYKFERRMFGSQSQQCDRWPHGCSSKVEKWSWNRRRNMETVWEALERHWKPLRQKKEAQAGVGTLHWHRRSPIADAGRKRTVQMPNPGEAAGGSGIDSELVPDTEKRLWRTVTQDIQLTRDRVRCRTNWNLFWKEVTLSCLPGLGSARRQ